MPRSTSKRGIAQLPAFDDATGGVFGVVEAVKGTRNKFKFHPERGLFIHDSVLPAGAMYPFDFGFIPSTKADDGDPVDVLILLDEPFSGLDVGTGLVLQGPCNQGKAVEVSDPSQNGDYDSH